nr:IS66 family insertion sequence element accessory protein TnpB [Nitrosomonas nitrosa]
MFGAARPHHAYLYANKRATRMKVLVHDGIGVWLAARRLNQGRFTRASEGAHTATLTRAQLDALVLGLPWQRVGDGGPARAPASRAPAAARWPAAARSAARAAEHHLRLRLPDEAHR